MFETINFEAYVAFSIKYLRKNLVNYSFVGSQRSFVFVFSNFENDKVREQISDINHELKKKSRIYGKVLEAIL